MNRIDYKKVKEIPIAKVLERYENDLREENVSGDLKLVGHCPICHPNGGRKHRNNQFQATVKSDDPDLENTFICFACGARGSVVDFVVLAEKLVSVYNVDWPEVAEKRKIPGNKWNWCPISALKEASRRLNEWFLEEQEDERVSGNTPWAKKFPKKPVPTYFKFYQENEYLLSRGISREILEEFQVGYYENARSSSVLNRHILFPIHNQLGQLLAFAWRTTNNNGDRYCFPRIEQFDRSLELYNLHRAIKEGSKVVVVEGFFDCMKLYQAGFKCVVAVMGSNLSTDQAKLLKAEFETATFLLDPDDPGRKLGLQAIKKLLTEMPIRIVKGTKQPDEMSESEIAKVLK